MTSATQTRQYGLCCAITTSALFSQSFLHPPLLQFMHPSLASLVVNSTKGLPCDTSSAEAAYYIVSPGSSSLWMLQPGLEYKLVEYNIEYAMKLLPYLKSWYFCIMGHDRGKTKCDWLPFFSCLNGKHQGDFAMQDGMPLYLMEISVLLLLLFT